MAAIARLCPAHVAEDQWDLMVQEQLRARSREGYQWEELISSWTAMFGLLVQQHVAAAQADGSPCPELPTLEEFMLRMYTMEDDPAAQLDMLASYRPDDMRMHDWDRAVGKVSVKNSTECMMKSTVCW